MKTKWTVVLIALAMGLACVGCHSENKKTRKLSIEGPEKKTEVKIETTEKK